MPISLVIPTFFGLILNDVKLADYAVLKAFLPLCVLLMQSDTAMREPFEWPLCPDLFSIMHRL